MCSVFNQEKEKKKDRASERDRERERERPRTTETDILLSKDGCKRRDEVEYHECVPNVSRLLNKERSGALASTVCVFGLHNSEKPLIPKP